MSASRHLRPRLGVLALLFFAFASACGASPARHVEPVVGSETDASRPPAPAAETDAIVPIGPEDAVRGSRSAPVTFVVFSDFQCPFCARLERTVARLRERYGDDNLRIVFKNFPLGMHPSARRAAEVGQGVLALSGPSAFWRYHDAVFAEQESMSPDSLRAAAVATGVDGAELDRGLEVGRWSAKVDADLALARSLRVEGAPGSFVNGIAVSGAKGIDAFESLVDVELDKAKALVAGGIPADQVYRRLAAVNFKSADQAEAEAEAEAEAAAAAETQIVHRVPIGPGPARGPATAPVTVVEFADFQCSYCKRAESVLGEIRTHYGDKVRFVWRDLPLSGHARAEPAAELARAARAQAGDTAFWKVHDLLFAAQPSLEDADLEHVAGDAKLDVARATAQMRTHAFGRAIDADADLADDLEVDGTPTFFVNGHRLVGAQSFDKWRSLLDAEIAKAEALVSAGTPPAAVYDALVKDGKAKAEPQKRALGAPPAESPFLGARGAKILVQEVGDFQCPYCARAEATMEELLKLYPGQLKVVWRDKPLPMHPDAPLAAEAAREAFAQKGEAGFERMRKLLFADSRALKRTDLDGYAREIGLDSAKFAAALDSHRHRAAVEADVAAAETAGVRGTPAFFVGPYWIEGAESLRRFRRLAELAGAKPADPAPAARVR